jgi:hypothetical protein
MRICVISALHTLAHEVPCPLYQISDETVMKILVGLVGATLKLSSGAFAQPVSCGAHGAGGGMHDVTCIPTVIDGSATTPAAMIRTITSIIL